MIVIFFVLFTMYLVFYKSSFSIYNYLFFITEICCNQFLNQFYYIQINFSLY